MAANIDNDIPQWKKDLIARLRVQNRRSITAVTVGKQLNINTNLGPPLSTTSATAVVRAVQQPRPAACCTSSSIVSAAVGSRGRGGQYSRADSDPTCQQHTVKMVQERTWCNYKYDSYEMVPEKYENGDYCKSSDSDSSEELHYGPGIVNKLKNKYLSLALRGDSYRKSRPSILNLRKATSLENLLDDDDDDDYCCINSPDLTDVHLTQSKQNGTSNTTTTHVKKNLPNRYRNATRGNDILKRARSVETISSNNHHENIITASDVKPKRESLHEDILIITANEGNDKPSRKMNDKKTTLETNNDNNLFSNNYVPRINKPKRIAPMMNEKEKPPADVVKHAKMIFEKRPENRTKPPIATGDVASKVASYKNIIVKSRNAKKTHVKPADNAKVQTRAVSNLNLKNSEEKVVKTVAINEEKGHLPVVPHTNVINDVKIETEIVKPEIANKPNSLSSVNELHIGKPLSHLPISPIPDVSRIDFPHTHDKDGFQNSSSLSSETPDLILTSSPLPISSSSYAKTITEEFIKGEVDSLLNLSEEASPFKEVNKSENTNTVNSIENNLNQTEEPILAFNFIDPNLDRNYLQTVKTSTPSIPYNEPLKLIINGNSTNNKHSKKTSPSQEKVPNVSPRITSPLTSPNRGRKIVSPPIKEISGINFKSNLTDRVIEKNLINTAKSLEKSKLQVGGGVNVTDNSEEFLQKLKVPKKVTKPSREPESNSVVFKFTDRKDVPDYVGNDKSRTVGKLERPKVGEGGIILLPGASIDESFTDEEEEIMRYLDAPPSPCDVTFINDNILIDGKSSFSQKTKKARLTISFMDSGPEVYEYPSETSLMVEDETLNSPINAQVGRTVPTLSGSTLANYTPKSTEEFQPGVTRSKTCETDSSLKEIDTVEEEEPPIVFSAGTNSDILF